MVKKMRIWSLHPQYLDSKGLVALWRETLLAQKVLLGQTNGYKNHPQLNRFKTHLKPLSAIGFYLQEVYKEAANRGYNFNKRKIYLPSDDVEKILVTTGQSTYEFNHLKKKLETRAPKKYQEILAIKTPKIHALFNSIEGEIESWEIV
jgi:hypothetical protein